MSNRVEGLSVFIVEMRGADGELVPGLSINPIPTMMNHNTNEVFFDDVEIPTDALIGTEGMGFRHILDGMNAERILIAAECIGDGRFFLDKASAYANEREVFGRPIGMNQGVQFPLAKAYANLRAADLMRWQAANLFDPWSRMSIDQKLLWLGSFGGLLLLILKQPNLSTCLLYTSPSPRDGLLSRMPSSA